VLQRAGLEVADDILAACALAFDGISGAGIERETAAIARAAVLSSGDAATVIAQLAVDRLREQVGDDADRRSAFCAVATEHLGLSHRAVGKILGITHPTVAKLARQWRPSSVMATQLVATQ
jgi:hypothetical protein